MHLSQKVALNTIIQIITKVITVGFGLVLMILLTSSLGREGYGNYMYILTLVTLFGSFADWGTATIGVREASKQEKKKQEKILVNVFFLRLFLACLGALLMILAGFFLPLKVAQPLLLRQGIFLGSLILILFAFKASFGLIFQTRLQMQKLAVADILASALVLFFSWLFLKINWGLSALIMAVVLANLAAVVLAGFLAFKTIRFTWHFDLNFAKKFLKESLPMGAILLMFTVDNKIDTVMLGSLKGSGAVGIYAVAYRIYDVLILGAAYLMSSLLPVISQYAYQPAGWSKLRIIYQKSFDVLLFMGLAVLLISFLGSPFLIKFLTQQRFGEFFDSVIVLKILSLAIFLSYFNHLTGYTIVSLGKQGNYFKVALAALIFNVAANLVIIPYLSYYGAALVTVLTEGITLIITTFFIFRFLKIVPSLFTFPKTLKQLVQKRGKIF
jgi:O-antigen/teichoic acid export membrane protein